MPRIQFSDVTPPEKRSIRNIPIPNGGKRTTPIIVKSNKSTFDPNKTIANDQSSNFNSKMSEITEKKESGAYEYYYPKNTKESEKNDTGFKPTKSKRKYIWSGITLAVILVFILSMMTVLASAKVNITPKSQKISVDMKINATNEMTKDAIRYEIIKLSKSQTVSVPATSEEAVELKASGKIIIYNNFSTEPQRLIIRTRFESSEGLIYRIPESIVVPGKTVKNGTETPGSIEVEVFADEPGEKFNIKKTDFTIPGFKNDAGRFKNLYARSSTEMTGGFVGKMKKVTENEKQTALQSIDSELETDLKKDLESKVPEGLVLLSNSIIYKTKELPNKEDGSSVVIGKEITAYATMLNTYDLSNKITSEYISKLENWNNIKTIVKNFSKLSIVNTPENIENGGNLNLQIKGEVNVLADIDTNLISQRLLGMSKKDGIKLIDEFTGISNITAAIRPVWKQSFPTNPSKIYIQINTND